MLVFRYEAYNIETVWIFHLTDFFVCTFPVTLTSSGITSTEKGEKKK